MSLQPDSYEEALRRQRKWNKRQREAAERYQDRIRDEVLSGEREWSSLERRPKSREAFEKQFGSVERIRFVHRLGCIIGKDCSGPMHAHHVVSRARGGGPDDLAPLCQRHHSEVHTQGVETFEREHGTDLRAEAARVARLWREHTTP